MKNIIVTGGFGFIGFNAIMQWSMQMPETNFIILDALTYAAQFNLIDKLQYIKNAKNIFYYIGRIESADILETIYKKFKIDAIVNFAAETHVDNSITGPKIFFDTNVIGTTNLLEFARKYDIRFHQVSTDEVYGPSKPEDNITAESMLYPSSPYSSSKASADLIALSYWKTFGTKVTISRCTNNIGPWQHYEKLVPTVISKALNNEKIPVYGDGLQKRHWTFVNDHNDAVMQILLEGEVGKIYNIGPSEDNYISNIDLIKSILDILGKPYSLIEHVKDRAAHDVSYYLRPTSIICEAPTHLNQILDKIVDWYKYSYKSKIIV